jgi:hypothetical protein
VGNYPCSLQLPLPHVCRLARLAISPAIADLGPSATVGCQTYFQLLEKGRIPKVLSHPTPDSLFNIGRGSEDYRWVYVRKLVMANLPSALEPLVLVTFNLVFISFIQNILLFLITSPYSPQSHETNFLQKLLGHVDGTRNSYQLLGLYLSDICYRIPGHRDAGR